MKYPTTYNVIFGCVITCFSYSVSAQDIHNNSTGNTDGRTEKNMKNYRILKNMGYGDQEIFEDLGNANFLNKDYETALFWYKKLKDNSKGGSLSSNYNKRYQHALQQTVADNASTRSDSKDWLAMIQSDYQVDSHSLADTSTGETTGKYRELDFRQKNDLQFLEEQLLSENDVEPSKDKKSEAQNLYRAPIAVTPDGSTAYFSKPVYVKPLYGVFSKKELVHKIYKAEKVNGQWKNIEEIALAPKHSSAMHPAISEDGKRLFFASNMPGTFGEYDIYVSTLKSDGTFGVSKNLGRKVNTKKNDLYPNVVEGNTLAFASEGHRGYGGLDVYMAKVGKQNVSLAMNLGGEINSGDDDFAVSLTSEKGMGYVMSNRGGKKADVQKVAFSFDEKDTPGDKRDHNILEALNNSQLEYTSSLFEDE